MSTPLREIAAIKTGYTFRSRLEGDPSGEWAVIQMKDLNDQNQLEPTHLARIPTPRPAPKQVVEPGDLIFRSRGQNNTAVLVDAAPERTILAAPLLLIRSTRRILPAFLQWWINHPASQAALAGMAEGTSVRMISKESLEKLPVPLPPREVQQQVAALAALCQQEQIVRREIARLRQLYADRILLSCVRDDFGSLLTD